MGEEQVKALDNINLTIKRNEYIAITGSSGSGKSTLMNILGCLDKATHGAYFLNQQDVSQLSENQLAEIRNKEIGFIFQSFNLLPRANALSNVMLPLIYRGIPLNERIKLAKNALRKVKLEDRMNHIPSQLSGGQRQRVAIARALVTNPSILLADEPTGNLDSHTTREIMSLFDLLQQEGQTIIMVTHEDKIARHCHRLICLNDGKIVEDTRNEQGSENVQFN